MSVLEVLSVILATTMTYDQIIHQIVIDTMDSPLGNCAPFFDGIRRRVLPASVVML